MLNPKPKTIQLITRRDLLIHKIHFSMKPYHFSVAYINFLLIQYRETKNTTFCLQIKKQFTVCTLNEQNKTNRIYSQMSNQYRNNNFHCISGHPKKNNNSKKECIFNLFNHAI